MRCREGVPDESPLIQRLSELFHQFDLTDLKIGCIWLHPIQFRILKASVYFDHNAVGELTQAISFQNSRSGGYFEGHLWGANVLKSVKVPQDRVGVVPDSFPSELVDFQTCSPFMFQVPTVPVSSVVRRTSFREHLDYDPIKG